MLRGRAPSVQILASVAVAAMAVGLVVPTRHLRAQLPAGTTPSPGPDLPPVPQPEPNPLPPAIPATGDAAVTVTKATTYTPEGTLADPEGAAKSFVEKSQREADEAIAALAKEAETLRARLQKVEAGLARWQAVKDSLGSTAATRPAWRPRTDGPPAILEPIAAPGTEPRRRRNADPGDGPKPTTDADPLGSPDSEPPKPKPVTPAPSPHAEPAPPGETKK